MSQIRDVFVAKCLFRPKGDGASLVRFAFRRSRKQDYVKLPATLHFDVQPSVDATSIRRESAMRVQAQCALLGLFVSAVPAAAQQSILSVNPGFLSTATWCKDTGTLCWTDPKSHPLLTGIRFVAEPNTGGLSQDGNNRVEASSLQASLKAGIEINLYKGVVSVQGSFIPQTTVVLDGDSRLVTSGRLADPERKMGVNSGYTLGLTLFNGIIAVGYGRLSMDTRRVASATSEDDHISFFFLNLQPLSTIRAAISQVDTP